MAEPTNAHAPNGRCSQDGCQRGAVIGGRCVEHFREDADRERAERLAEELLLRVRAKHAEPDG